MVLLSQPLSYKVLIPEIKRSGLTYFVSIFTQHQILDYVINSVGNWVLGKF